MGEEADLVVHAFEGSVGEAVAEEVEDAVEVFGDGVGDAAEGLEARASGSVDPGVEALPSPAGVNVVVGGKEVLLEQVGAEDFPVELLEPVQPLAFGLLQVPRSFQESEACVFEFPAVGCRQLSDFLPADGIEGLVEESFDVEAVEDGLGVGAASFDGLDEGVGHVDGDESDAGAAVLPELVEKPIQGLGGLALSDPDWLARFVVHHDGDVLVPALIGELVNADEGESFEPLGVELLADDPGRDATDGDPGDLEEFFHVGLVGHSSESGDLILEVAGEEGAGSGPGDFFRPDAAASATDPAQIGLKQGRSSQDCQVSPDALLAVMNTAGDPAAAATAWDRPARNHLDAELLLLESNRTNPEPLAGKQAIE